MLDRSINKNYIALGKFMSKRCELTGVSPLKGHNVSHSNAALRTVDFKGGLDKYLMTAKNSNLSSKVKKIKQFISSKI